jgi:TetR/AcrR family transcriptional regulator
VQETRIQTNGSKAKLTRAAILAAAENEFARRGYVATRLEDVAAVVGLKRAALFYHFRDKQSLYGAVLAEAFGPLAAGLREAFLPPGSVSARIERAVGLWVDTIVSRPTIARLILRHAAEAEDHAPGGMFPGVEEVIGTAWALFEEGRANGELNPVNEDPFHAASAVLGATIFYVSALSSLLPDAKFNPLAAAQIAAHKRDALRTVRMLLGIRAPRRRSVQPAAPTRPTGGSKSARTNDDGPAADAVGKAPPHPRGRSPRLVASRKARP